MCNNHKETKLEDLINAKTIIKFFMLFILFIFLIFKVNAVSVYDTYTPAFDGTEAWGRPEGQNWKANSVCVNGCVIDNITLSPNSDGTYLKIVWVGNNSEYRRVKTDNVKNVAVFGQEGSGNATIFAGQSINVYLYGGTLEYDAAAPSEGYPVPGVNFNCTSAVISDSFPTPTYQTNRVRSLTGIGSTALGSTPPPVSQDYINLSQPQPNNNTKHYNYLGPFYFNITANVSSVFSSANITFYVDGILFNQTVTNGSNKVTFPYLFSAMASYTYYFNGTVYNLDGSINQSEKTATYTLIIDTLEPLITRNPQTNFLTDNSSKISSKINDLRLDYTFSDDNLYQVLINITNSTNKQKFAYHNSSIGGTSLRVNKTIDLDSWALGNYTILIQSSDSHTTKEIKTYSVDKNLLGTKLTYHTAEGTVISVEVLDLWLDIASFDTTKLKDRYTFSLELKKKPEYITFRVHSDKPLIYLEESEYPGHFISGHNWVDFNEPDLKKEDLAIEIIDQYTAEVTIIGPKKSSYYFNSIGGLNINTVAYTFEVASTVEVRGFNRLTGAAIPINLTYNGLNYTGNNSNPARVYNVSKGLNNFTIYSVGFEAYPFYYNITANFHNLTYNSTPIGVTFYFYDESSQALIRNETFRVYLEKTGFSHTYDGITTNPHTITGLTNGVYKTKISSDNYPERQYLDITITNAKGDIVRAYLINSTQGAEISFNIKDIASNPLEGASVNFERVINGTYTTVAQELSDFAGGLSLYLDQNYQYRITASLIGYDTRIINLEPTGTSYNIVLSGGYVINFSMDYQDIVISYEPKQFYNGANNFTFTIYNPNGDLFGYGYNLTYPGGSVNISGTTDIGSTLRSNFTIVSNSPYDRLRLIYYYETNISGIRAFTYYYPITYGAANNTLMKNKSETYGLGLLERVLISVLIIVLLAGVGTLIGQPIAGFGMALFLYGFFVYIGFLPLWSVLITMLLGIIIIGSRPEG